MRTRILGLGAASGVLISLMLAAPASAGTGVSPPSFRAAVESGSSLTITKTVHTPPIPPNPDIVFLSDTTGSMGPAIANVRANATTIMNKVLAVQSTAEFAAAEYKDREHCATDPFNFRLDQALTANTANVQAGIGTWTASGGCDVPESQINALFQLATNATAGFRSNSTRIIAWFGDSNGHDPSVGHTLTNAINALVAAHIRVIAVPVITSSGNGLDSTGQATAIANATGGLVLPSASPDQVAHSILTGLKNLPVTVKPVPTCDSGLTATYDAASKTVTSGTDAIFKETLTVAPKAVGILKCSVDFLLNGNHVDGFQQKVTIIAFGVTAGGNFVIGDKNAARGTSVTFWGSQWSKRNTLSGGAAPRSFKGFENHPTRPDCGQNWVTRPGNSARPPKGPLPAFMLVLVSSKVTKSGSSIAGNTFHEVVVKTHPGYAPNPGHRGTGKVIARVC
jgi:Integrin beta chain VWA domain